MFRLVKDFQQIVAAAVARFRGSLNLYLGDGAMVTFSDFGGRVDCATRALGCAQTILAEIAALNDEHLNSRGPPVSISIGLQYGQVFVGSISSSRRFGPTVIGDAVNVASRLEQCARSLGAKVVAGNDLIQKARSESGQGASALSPYVQLGPLAVHGRNMPVNVWTFPAHTPSAALAPTTHKPGRLARDVRGSGAGVPHRKRDMIVALLSRHGLAWFSARP
jgi:adenylate cyclase